MNRLGKYLALVYKEYLRTAGRIILLDVAITLALVHDLLGQETIDGKEVQILDGVALSRKLELLLEEAGLYPVSSDTLVVFPGNGSLKPKDFMNLEDWGEPAFAYAKRYWKPGEYPIVHVGEIQTKAFLMPEIRTVLVIDDVISSGETMRKLRERNAWKFPQASWIAATWLTQVPRQKGDAGISGYDGLLAAMVAEGEEGRLVPINSLSTLLEDQKIATSYAGRHFKNPEAFHAWLDRCR